MIRLENKHLAVTISPLGAELQSVLDKEHDLEFLWQGDPAFWAKHSPVLFPIVGTLKYDRYHYQGKEYSLPRHGFARTSIFSVESHHQESAVFFLRASADTHAVYPFAFELRIKYTLDTTALRVTYHVSNPVADDLYFSVGGHPAFQVPLEKQFAYTDYFLEFNEEETSPKWPISPEGLILEHPEPLLKQTTVLPLSKELFFGDALVLKNISSSVVSLKSEKGERGLDFDFSGFPYLGIWAAKNADFVCIEPWCGIADSVSTNQDLTQKEGIIYLGAHQEFERSWQINLF